MPTTTPSLLITGASGFIGRHLLERLKESHRIVAVAREPPESRGAPTGPAIEWLQADIADAGRMASVLERVRESGGVDFVVHLAAYYDFTGKDEPDYRRTNVEGMRNVLEISRELRPRRFVFASSAAACDFTEPGEAVAEASAPDGDNPYARSKRAGEEMVRAYRAELPSCTVRFAALFSDWCEYEPLNYFLTTWLSPGWRRRILAGTGDSAIPYLHIRDAMAFFSKLLEHDSRLESGQTLLASTDGATSHGQLHAAATACHFGQRIRPLRMPRAACRAGIPVLDAMGRAAGRRPFERPWMARCIDRRLDVDARRTRALLDWEPRERLTILRRMPFLIHNRKAHFAEWLKRNHMAAKGPRRWTSGPVHDLLESRVDDIGRRYLQRLQQPAQRERLPAYVDGSRAELVERHRLLLEQLLCAVRTGDKAVFMNCCLHMAERWWLAGLSLDDLCAGLEGLGQTCLEVLREDPVSAGFAESLHDQIAMTFRFALDAVRELEETLELQRA